MQCKILHDLLLDSAFFSNRKRELSGTNLIRCFSETDLENATRSLRRDKNVVDPQKHAFRCV